MKSCRKSHAELVRALNLSYDFIYEQVGDYPNTYAKSYYLRLLFSEFTL